MLACAYPALDRPMILFQNVVEILHRSMPAILLQSLLGFEPHDGRWITGVLVGVDDLRRRMVLSAQSLGEKALGRCILTLIIWTNMLSGETEPVKVRKKSKAPQGSM